MSEQQRDEVVTWRGVALDDMTREELVEAFQQCAQMLRDANAPTNFGIVSDLRAPLRPWAR